MQEGISGKIAHFFINSKLTILLMIGLMIIGIYSSFLIPREEEPQIIVPMADVMVGYPGANPTEVENRVIKPLEKIISNIKGVEHVHSMAMNGQAVMVVQFSQETQEKTNVVLIPVDALVTKGQLSGVYTVSESNTALLRWLRLGRTFGDQIEVLSGLSANESYIISADGKLYNGVNVTIQ